MPVISRFYGIAIKMYYADHAPPHFHALYGGNEVVVAIDTLAVIRGRLPPRALGLVMEWAAQHQAELQANWAHARNAEPLESVDPLA